MTKFIKSPYFCIWDDDDIFLPWHIEDRIKEKLLFPEYNAIGHKVAFFSLENIIKNLGGNMFASQYLYDNNGVLPDENTACWDVSWTNKPWKWHHLDYPYKPSYIYRWGTGESHIGGYADEGGQHKVYLNNIEEKSKIKFDFPWIPYWKKDYVDESLCFIKITNTK